MKKRVLAPRAAAILYRLLVARRDRRPFLLPANICPIVPLVFLKAGAPFAFVDISPVTLHMDMDAALDRLTREDCGGLLYAHTYGDPSTPNDAFAAARQADASRLVIDDRCLCMPDLDPDASNAADAVLYSTGYGKIVDVGSGGYAFLREEVPCVSCERPFRREHLDALEREYKASIASRRPFVYRDSDWLETGADRPAWDGYGRRVTAARTKALEHRRRLNALFAARLPADWQLPPCYQAWRFNLRLPRRDAVLRAIFDAGLFASAHYASLAGILAPGRCPHAAALADEALNLFNDAHYTLEMAAKTCDIIGKHQP